MIKEWQNPVSCEDMPAMDNIVARNVWSRGTVSNSWRNPSVSVLTKNLVEQYMTAIGEQSCIHQQMKCQIVFLNVQ